jgi:translation initiation factor 3 subunit I
MKPILLMGHTRALTQIKFNRQGDLLFSVSKDNQASVWYSDNGERLGTFDGHQGTVWSIDISLDSQWLVTGSADNTLRIWSVQNGKEWFCFETKSAVRSVCFHEQQWVAFITDATMGQKSTIHILRQWDPVDHTQFVIEGSKATCIVWGKNNTLITGHDDGTVSVWDASGERILSAREHKKTITDIQLGTTRDYFITSSKDHTALVWKVQDLSVWKRFETERPVNSAAISPIRPHIMLGGGQDAMDVTTTSARQGKFETRFYHLVFEEEMGRVKGHFGPINTLAFHPLGLGYASGGEDGYVRLHHFDDSYFRFKYPEEK